MPLYELPVLPLQSLAQLRHANLAASDLEMSEHDVIWLAGIPAPSRAVLADLQHSDRPRHR